MGFPTRFVDRWKIEPLDADATAPSDLLGIRSWHYDRELAPGGTAVFRFTATPDKKEKVNLVGNACTQHELLCEIPSAEIDVR